MPNLTSDPPPEKPVSVKNFFEATPPGSAVDVADLCHDVGSEFYDYKLKISAIQLHCVTDSCVGVRFFDIGEQPSVGIHKLRNIMLT